MLPLVLLAPPVLAVSVILLKNKKGCVQTQCKSKGECAFSTTSSPYSYHFNPN
jgi:hypothetical protein